MVVESGERGSVGPSWPPSRPRHDSRVGRLFTEASITARPFFEAEGFVVLSQQVVLARGAEFVNYRMERVLA